MNRLHDNSESSRHILEERPFALQQVLLVILGCMIFKRPGICGAFGPWTPRTRRARGLSRAFGQNTCRSFAFRCLDNIVLVTGFSKAKAKATLVALHFTPGRSVTWSVCQSVVVSNLGSFKACKLVNV